MERYSSQSPLVSILIPAYKHEYFESALCSALAQTYRPIEILVGDDSPDDHIHQICNRYPYVQYQKNTGQKSMEANINKLVGRVQGDFVKLLLDDDILHPFCVDEMVRILRHHPGVSLVTSCRGLINSNSIHYDSICAFAKKNNKDTVMKGKDAQVYALSNITNIFGELSTYMFRKEQLQQLAGDNTFEIEMFAGTRLTGLSDIALGVKLCGCGDAYFINKDLSYFRKHQESITGQRGAEYVENFMAWMPLLQEAYSNNILTEGEYGKSLRALRSKYRIVEAEFPLLKDTIRTIDTTLNALGKPE